MQYVLLALAVSFLMTEGLETAVALLFNLKNKFTFSVIFLVNLLTNPVAVVLKFIFYMLLDETAVVVPLIELAVLFFESFLYFLFSKDERFTIKNPVLYAITANVVSFAAGELVNMLI